MNLLAQIVCTHYSIEASEPLIKKVNFCPAWNLHTMGSIVVTP